MPQTRQQDFSDATVARLDNLVDKLRAEIERLRGVSQWTKITDAMPPQDNGDIGGGERWFLTYHEATGTYDVACITRDLGGGYGFAGFAMGVSHWREITNDFPAAHSDEQGAVEK